MHVSVHSKSPVQVATATEMGTYSVVLGRHLSEDKSEQSPGRKKGWVSLIFKSSEIEKIEKRMCKLGIKMV